MTEHEDKHILTQWLKDYDMDVWWEERNDWGYPTFRIRRGNFIPQSKPDLVIQGDVTVACEFKPVSKSGVYDAMLQIHGYWFDHALHEQEYVCGGDPVEIDGFVTATRNSIAGHLFSSEDEAMLSADGYGAGRERAIRNGDLPMREWNMTEQHVRSLWRLRKRAIDNNNSLDPAPAIGTLLSTVLDGDADPVPAVLWRVANGQDWRRLA